MDVDEVSQLLEIDLDDPLAVRDRAMLETMYGGGLRLAELVGIDCRHLDRRAVKSGCAVKAAKSAACRLAAPPSPAAALAAATQQLRAAG